MISNILSKGVLVLVAILGISNSFAQTYYSEFSSPSLNSEYAYSTSGLCIGCNITNPSNAATMSTIDSTRLYMTIGVGNKVTIKLKLSDTAYYEAGFKIKNTSGLLNASLLSAMVIRTYYNSNLVSSASGSSAINLTLINSSTQLMSTIVNQKFNYVEMEIDNAATALWDLSVFYGFGSVLAPLPVRIVDLNFKDINGEKKLNWQLHSDNIKHQIKIYSSENTEVYTLIDQYSTENHSNYALFDYTLNNLSNEVKVIKLEILNEFSKVLATSSVVVPVKELQISIWPNPASNYLTIEGGDLDSDQVQFFDAMGKTVNVTLVKNTGTITYNMSDLPKGTYMIVVSEACHVNTYTITKSE